MKKVYVKDHKTTQKLIYKLSVGFGVLQFKHDDLEKIKIIGWFASLFIRVIHK